MTPQRLSLSISNCTLPTAVEWVVTRRLREWHKQKNLGTTASPPTASAECPSGELSPFWIPVRAAYLLRDALLANGHIPSGPLPGITQSTHNCTTKKQSHSLISNWENVFNVCGVSFVNAADTSISSFMDSATCASCNIPVDESGDVVWPLVGLLRQQTLQKIAAAVGTRRGADNTTLRRGPLAFHSPYWLEGPNLEKRWKNISIAPNALPFFVERGSMWFINAEQTTDASRFDSLSCTPHRKHHCLRVDGAYNVSWEFSEKLAQAFAEMVKNEKGAYSSPTADDNPNRPQPNDSHPHRHYTPRQLEGPNNLWVDVELLDRAGWSLREGAAAVELPPDQLTRQKWGPAPRLHSAAPEKNAKPIVAVNAEFVRERESLLDVIAYKPDYIGPEGGGNTVGADTTLQLALLAHEMRYASPTWICAGYAQRAGLCGKETSNAACGVEVTLFQKGELRTRKVVLINMDELNITQERILELRS